MKHNFQMCESFRSINELKVPDVGTDGASIAPSDEPDLDYRKKIKYGNRIQVLC